MQSWDIDIKYKKIYISLMVGFVDFGQVVYK